MIDVSMMTTNWAAAMSASPSPRWGALGSVVAPAFCVVDTGFLSIGTPTAGIL
jgi:hypothetical protein